MQSKEKMKRAGRPPKFREPRHPVTMTLPKRILNLLAEIDQDRACAVVKVTEAVLEADKGRFKPVELIEMAPGKFLIIVRPSKALRQIPWLKLIEIAPSRYLLTIPSGTPFEALEVVLRDLSSHPEMQNNKREKPVLYELLNLIGHHRRTERLSKAEILIFEKHESQPK